MENLVAARFGPIAGKVDQELDRIAVLKAGPSATEMILHDPAYLGEQAGADHLLAQTDDDQVHGCSESVPQSDEVLMIEEIPLRGAHATHGVPVDLLEVFERGPIAILLRDETRRLDPLDSPADGFPRL